MKRHIQQGLRRSASLSLVTAMLAAGTAWAAPPTASSAATSVARDAYRGCLLAALSSVPAAASPMVVWSATDACTDQEAALTSALREENPDRPLFAKSHVLSLKEDAVAQQAPDAIVGNRSTITVARITRP